jgi:hypothetical protein
MALPPGILTEEHKQLAEQMIHICDNCKPITDFAREIGLPMTNAEEQLAGHRQFARNILKHGFGVDYGPIAD